MKPVFFTVKLIGETAAEKFLSWGEECFSEGQYAMYSSGTGTHYTKGAYFSSLKESLTREISSRQFTRGELYVFYACCVSEEDLAHVVLKYDAKILDKRYKEI